MCAIGTKLQVTGVFSFGSGELMLIYSWKTDAGSDQSTYA
jgi:hypothetical protein